MTTNARSGGILDVFGDTLSEIIQVGANTATIGADAFARSYLAREFGSQYGTYLPNSEFAAQQNASSAAQADNFMGLGIKTTDALILGGGAAALILVLALRK